MGVVSGADEKKLGLDGSSTTVLMLDNVHVPVGNVLGTIGEGHKVAFNILNLGRVKLGTRNIAGAKQALNQSIAYAKERRQFGKAICEFGLVKQKLAEMTARCFVGDAMVYRALGDVDRALDGIDQADGAKRAEDHRDASPSSARSTRCGRARRWPTSWTRRCRCSAATAIRASSRSSAPTATPASRASTRAPTRSTG